MATWDFDAPTQDPRLLRVQEYVTQTLQSSKAGLNAVRMLSLYEFLKAHQFSNAEDLRQTVRKEGQPLFTPEEAQQVFDQLRQTGGSAPSPEFFDKIFRKLLAVNPFELIGQIRSILPTPPSLSLPSLSLPSFSLPSYETLQPWLFILYAFERDAQYGPPLSVALDTVSKLLPTIGLSVQSFAAPLAGAIPLPGGGAIGAIIGWAVSAIFVFMAILMNLSRRKFGTAFVTAMSLIPLAGPALSEAAEDLESTMARVSKRREKLVNSARSILGDEVASQLESVIPDLDTEEDDIPIDPPFSIPRLTDLVNPGALVASQADVEALADRATGEATQSTPVAPTPPTPVAPTPPTPVAPTPPTPIPKPTVSASQQPLTTGKGRTKQWRKTLRSRRR